MSAALAAFINSPVGPKTTHFWGPVCNSGFVVQGIIDWDRPAEKISRNMQLVLTMYSISFLRFAWKVQPRNYLMFAMHIVNQYVQGRLFIRRVKYDRALKKSGAAPA